VLAAKWRGMDDTLPEDWQIDIWSEFALALTKLEDLAEIRQLRQQGDLSRITAIGEYTRRGVISDRIDPDEEAERIDDELLAAAEKFGLPTDEDDDEGQDADEDEAPAVAEEE